MSNYFYRYGSFELQRDKTIDKVSRNGLVCFAMISAPIIIILGIILGMNKLSTSIRKRGER